MNSVLSIIGLSFDIVGAYFISKSPIKKNTYDLICELNPTVNSEVTKEIFEKLYLERNNNRIGFILLTIGFSIQLFSNLLQLNK